MLQARQSYFKPYTLPAAATDFLLNCCAILFATTIYSGAPQVLNGLLVLPTLATLLQSAVKDDKAPKQPAKPEANGKLAETQDEAPVSDKSPMPTKPFITMYRGAMMISTCTSILAVDFPAVFPRRFAKTESFGTSLMDLGVGSFVFAAGIVAARQHIKEQTSGSPSISARFRDAMRHSLPLALLGLVRLWSVKGLDYAEHVSEYGVHWNFFFTLALLPLANALLHPILKYFPSYGLLAFIIACGWEIALNVVYDLKRYIILSERQPDDWLSQNREGVFSLIGYLAIFIGGMGIGTGILTRDSDTNADTKPVNEDINEDEEWLASVLGGETEKKEKLPIPQLNPMKPDFPKTTFFHLAKWTVIWFLICGWAMWRYGPHLRVSRRMANLAYIVWVCGFNTAQLLLFCTIEKVLYWNLYDAKDKETERQRVRDATSTVMHAFNRNGLALFLLANLLTGAINMGLETLYMSEVQAMVVFGGVYWDDLWCCSCIGPL